MKWWPIISIDHLQRRRQERQQIPLPTSPRPIDPLYNIINDNDHNSMNQQEKEQSIRGVIIIDM